MAKTLAIHLDEETTQRLRFIGETASLTQDQLLEEAVRSYSREKEQYIRAVQQGREDVRAGRVISHKDLVADLEARLADLD